MIDRQGGTKEYARGGIVSSYFAGLSDGLAVSDNRANAERGTSVSVFDCQECRSGVPGRVGGRWGGSGTAWPLRVF